MKLTFLGHAGFCVETPEATVIMDPWMSAEGAFRGAWFQYPENHHLAGFVRDKLSEPGKRRFLYVSHEHKDHCDLPFLRSLPGRDFTVIIPAFRRQTLRAVLTALGCREVVALAHGESLELPGGSCRMYVDDSELDCDSAILLRLGGQTFLNFNDCKLFDCLPSIVRAEGGIDCFTCQFTGASWHPVCYEYEPATYQQISRRRTQGKFESVARSIELLAPRAYLPSAGPACFLDPELLPIHEQPVHIFSQAPELFAYLDRRLSGKGTQLLDIMPGDRLDIGTLCFEVRNRPPMAEAGVFAYLQQYAARREEVFAANRALSAATDRAQVRARLREELLRKLAHFDLAEQLSLTLYLGLREDPAPLLCVDFQQRTVTEVEKIAEEPYYAVWAPAWEYQLVLDRHWSWEDFVASFRKRVVRRPDAFSTMLTGFLFLEVNDLPQFCAKLRAQAQAQERIHVELDGQVLSVDRYCPHQGADLRHGWIDEQGHLVCPRHGWRFDLRRGGVCTSNTSCVHARGGEPI